ncbi:precorrin-6x reductase [Azorhizobium caulinodans ORS 571]|uniref:Precorrin-6x reductase n=1 Tax=Azorhizobium caulinodans (strain ATCC 43989 / DSM 5975 / JCM 20966 / LMG 6465 / NBRC 14845 / NCIMB 13405 / ORS 571) TaxID=438753 RepID=A8IKR3_AZOC5|nr:cobalt-precorrin-6A reductase [Azorhizobium caulinodans]BAF89939.1 precorrin-6x reductase [Azorhizobium caulinodans ORS 571]
MPRHILILGGTGEARRLAARLAGEENLHAIVSLAGRTENPAQMPVPVRVGGFGGIAGLRDYLAAEAISAVVDATHPYAAQMSRHAAAACAALGVPLLALRRQPWKPVDGDRWREVEGVAGALAALGETPRRVFLALGRNEVRAFEAAPRHSYLVRSVDAVEPPLAVPNANYVVARGPFTAEGDLDLLRDHGIEIIVAKNSGGPATYGKMEAARALGLEVILLRRPDVPDVPAVETVEEVAHWLERTNAPDTQSRTRAHRSAL